MGSFSRKCAISSLPVTAGNDVVLLLGETFNGTRGIDTGGYVMQNHFFNLIAPPIFGKYDDYGWIEDTEQDSLEFASEAIRLLGTLEASSRGEAIDITGEVHWSIFNDQMTKLVPNYDHAFIHRAVWDNLVNSSKKNFAEQFYSYKDENKQVTKLAKKYNAKVGQYGVYAFPQDAFNIALELWSTNLVKRPTGTPNDYLDFLMEDVNSASRTMSDRLVGFFRKQKSYRSVDVEYVDKLLALMNTDARKQTMVQTQLFYNAIMKGGLIVRGNEDTASEEQCGGPYWPHVAVGMAMGEIIKDRFEDIERDNEAEDQKYTDSEMIEMISKDGLNESYEFKE